MEPVERPLNNLKLNEASEKGKQEIPLKNNQDGNINQSGEDSIDSGFSNKAPSLLDLKEMVSIVPTKEDQVLGEGSREDVQMKETEDDIDAVPSNIPKGVVIPQAKPLPKEHSQHEQETKTGLTPATGPGPRHEDGARYGAEGSTVRQALNMEKEKDLILYETAELIAGNFDLRQMALRLYITEPVLAQIEHDNPKLIQQFYQVFQRLSNEVTDTEEMFTKLLEALVQTHQRSTAKWLRERLGIREPEASIEGEESSAIPDLIPQTEPPAVNDTFYDIFLMHAGKSEFTAKFQSICNRHNWQVKTSDTIPLTAPVHAAIEDILCTSTHLALIITENDCKNYRDKKDAICMTVEMALQLAYIEGSLAAKVLPIRCCERRSLPLVLQALTGAHINEDSFEERLVQTIDTRIRLRRMREKRN